MTSIFGFSESFANDIKDVVEIVKSSGEQMDFGHSFTPEEDEFYYVKLEADLDAPADLTEPTTAKALVMMPSLVTAGNPKSGLASTGQSIDVVNRFVSFTAGEDEVILVKRKWGEFIPLNAGGGSGEIMYFTIDAVNCPGDGNWTVTPTHYSGGCKSPPGADSYTGEYCVVPRTCPMPEMPDELIGQEGIAARVYNLYTCELEWREIDHCPTIGC